MTLGQRFHQALKACRGALVISHANLAEVTAPADIQHGTEIAEFLESALPNVYFALFDVERAMKQEIQPRDNSIHMMLPPDIDLLKEVGRQRPDDLQPLSLRDVVNTIVANREDLGTTWRQSNQAIADRINKMWEDPALVQTAGTLSNHPVGAPTLAVFRELLRPTFLDLTARVNANDGGDIQHAILSISYCDFAPLDGRWEDFNGRMKRRFTELGVSIPTASVFSARRDGVEQFFRALQSAAPGVPSPRT